jgi:hypothetical protein
VIDIIKLLTDPYGDIDEFIFKDTFPFNAAKLERVIFQETSINHKI